MTKEILSAIARIEDECKAACDQGLGPHDAIDRLECIRQIAVAALWWARGHDLVLNHLKGCAPAPDGRQ